MTRLFNILLFIIFILVILLIYLPLIILILFAFSKTSIIGFPMQGFSLKWFIELLNDKMILTSLKNSLIISLSTAGIATAVGTSAAFALVRARFPGKNLFTIVMVLPLVVPAVVLGLALLILFNELNIKLSLITVIIGHLTFTTSFVTLVVSASLYNFDTTLEEAARDLGANAFKTFYKITLPIIFSGVLAGALFAFTLSFDEYMIAFLNIGVKTNLPITIMGMMRFGISPKINALASFIYLVSFILALFAGFLVTKRGIKILTK